MTVQSYVQGQEGENHSAVAPFDWGLNFALSHIVTLIQLAFIPAIIKVGLRYLEFFRPLSLRQTFVVAALDIATKTWLLVVIMLLSIVVFQGGRYRLFALGQRALLTMPKVLLSSIMLLMIAGAFFLAPWMYLFVLFLMWAPFFTSAEISAKSYRAEEDEEDDELDDEYVRPEMRLRTRVVRFFADKPVWDLGFSRSIQFTANRRNFIVTVQLALLMLVALTLPLATVFTFAGYYHSFGWIVFESLFSYLVNAFVLAVACASFLKLLPREAIEEIGIVPETTGKISVRRPLRLHGKIVPFSLIAVTGFLATLATVAYIKANNSRPPNVQTVLESMEHTEQQFIFRLKLEDRTNLFRWLNPLGFRLKVVPDGREEKKVEVAAKTEADEEGEKLLEPERVMPYSLDGTPLPEENFVPSKEPLRLVLYFASGLEEGETKGKYVLYYLPLLGEPEPFLEGKFGE